MNFCIKGFLLLYLVNLFLTGCGPVEKNSETNNNDVKKVKLHISDTETKNKKEKNSDKHIRILKQNLTYQFNNQQFNETAFLKYSDNQNYSMYVLPNFKLTPAGHYHDILYLNEDHSIYMIIELLNKDDNLHQVKSTTLSQLSSISKEISTKDSFDDDFLKGSLLLEANNNNDIVSAYIINHKNIRLKLTMYNHTYADHRDEFFQMAQTIMKEPLNIH